MFPELAEVNKNNRLADMMRLYAARQNRGAVMVDQKRNPGTCMCCGQENISVKNAHGIKACTMCSTFMARVRKYPAQMAAEFVRLVGHDYFPLAGTPANGDELTTLTEANEQLASELRDLESYRDRLESEINEMRQQIEKLQDDNLELIEAGRPVNGSGSADLVPLSRLLTDRELLGAINTVVAACG